GMNENLVIERGGMMVTQQWRYPSWSECLVCHQPGAGWALGFNTPQCNLDQTYGAVTTNQIGALADMGYFDGPVSGENSWLALAPADDPSASLTFRVRSYLQANCVQCHGGGNAARWDASVFTSLSQADIIDGLLNRQHGDPANRVVVRGDTAHSMLLSRINGAQGGRMPPLASSVYDTQAVALVTEWIGSLTGYQTFAEWQVAHFGSTNAPQAMAEADPDGDTMNNEGEWLTRTDPNDALDAFRIDAVTVSNTIPTVHFQRLANLGFETWASTNIQISNLWHRLQVPDNRPWFSNSDLPAQVTDPTGVDATRKYYRLRVFEL
ncbi:MAG: hypothetical protein AAF492_21875, partial [Verrucomicrobiota bacterium]